ncbi:MAG: DcrB-related protein [Chloroflexi bacterium]|nr:DcrB-related protein [Chloroflexota bacterium]
MDAPVSPPDRGDPEPHQPQPGGPVVRGLVVRGLVLLGGLVLALLVLGPALGLGPGFSSQVSATATPDAFAAVRAEAQAAFERGQQHYAQGDFSRALIEFDRAKVNDPDSRQDIQAMLKSALDELRKQEPTPPPSATPQQTAGTPTPYTVYLPRVEPRSPPLPSPSPAPGATPPPRLQPYRDADQRFSLDVPRDWQVAQKPQAEAGVGVVGFRAPSGAASLVVSVDVLREAVSPELYAAHLETTMETLPGYALEQAAPTIVGGAPALRRLYSVKREGAGEPLRTVQVVVARSAAIFILTGTASANEFSSSVAAFDRMVSSFRMTP